MIFQESETIELKAIVVEDIKNRGLKHPIMHLRSFSLT